MCSMNKAMDCCAAPIAKSRLRKMELPSNQQHTSQIPRQTSIGRQGTGTVALLQDGSSARSASALQGKRSRAGISLLTGVGMHGWEGKLAFILLTD